MVFDGDAPPAAGTAGSTDFLVASDISYSLRQDNPDCQVTPDAPRVKNFGFFRAGVCRRTSSSFRRRGNGLTGAGASISGEDWAKRAGVLKRWTDEMGGVCQEMCVRRSR